MADPHWTSYAGMASGIIATLIAVVSYRKASKLKSLDLRIELRKEINTARTNIEQLIALVDTADGSRTATLAARGVLNSSMRDQWTVSVATDRIKIQNLNNDIPGPDTNFENYSQSGLENKMIKIHRINTELTALTDKYNSELDKDSENRRSLRETRR